MYVHAKIQKWGNSLGLRLSGILRDIPQLKEGVDVKIEVTSEGFIVKKTKVNKMQLVFPFSEKELIADLLPHELYNDLLVAPLKNESVDE